jgi:hypothetical protein
MASTSLLFETWLQFTISVIVPSTETQPILSVPLLVAVPILDLTAGNTSLLVHVHYTHLQCVLLPGSCLRTDHYCLFLC